MGVRVSRFNRAKAKLRRAYNAGRSSVRAAHAPDPEPEQVSDEPVDAPDATAADTPMGDDDHVSPTVRMAASWSWRLLVILAMAAAFLWVLGRLHRVVIPVAIAMLLSALLAPAVGWLRRKGVHRSLSTVLVMVGGLALVAGTLTLVISEFVDSAGRLADESQNGLRKIQRWLKGGVFHLTDQQLQSFLDTAHRWVRDPQANLTTGAIATATTALDVLTAIFLILFTTFFFLRDGDRIWRFVVNLLPRNARMPIANAGYQSWATLVAYVRATVLVAFIDAVGIGTGLAILRIELAFALAALVFLGAFIPIIGATLSGAVAILVALVTRGPFIALLVLAIVIGVQQLEGHVLQPVIMGRAVSIHPLAVILAIATGLVLAGIIGALVAVPIVAVLNTAVRHLAASRRHEPEPPPPTAVVVHD